jgi:Rrf2 family transcriptional regulator, nitric oxide-sensitive transcriptional repressor
MRLLAFTDFGLRALMRLAADYPGPPGRHLSTEALAGELAISRNHLVKVMQALAEAGFVRTLRGPKGGVALAVPPGEIRLGAVVRRLERDQALVECFRADGGQCNLLPCCRLKGALAEAREAFFASLDRLTLADCAIPAVPGR